MGESGEGGGLEKDWRAGGRWVIGEKGRRLPSSDNVSGPREAVSRDGSITGNPYHPPNGATEPYRTPCR